LQNQVKDFISEQRLSTTLKELAIDESYSNTIYKLMDKNELTDDTNDKDFKSIISKTIETYLPMLKQEESKSKVGFEKQEEKKPIGNTKTYLDSKYKDNPFYEG